MGGVSKHDLEQYAGWKREITKIKQEIAEGPTVVIDTVRGSKQNFPYIETPITIKGVDRRREVRNHNRLSRLEVRCKTVEQFIDSIEESDMRLLIEAYYVKELSWMQTVTRNGNRMSPDAARKAVNRFLDKNF